MKDTIGHFIGILIISSLVLVLGLVIIYIMTGNTEKQLTNNYSLIQTDPQRVIIVNKNLTIIQVISNTKKDVKPMVRLENITGTELPYTLSIQEQFFWMKMYFSFSDSHIEYDQRTGMIGLMINSITDIFKKD